MTGTKQSIKTTKIIYAAVFLALGVLLPQAFHAIGAGTVFLPMHIPVIIGGFVCGAALGVPIGILSVVLSSAIFGMPGFNPMGFSMIFELAAYGFFAGLFYKKIFAGKTEGKRIYFSLIITMIFGRIISIIAKFVIFSAFGSGFALVSVLTGLFVTAWPGIIIQLVAIPPIVYALKRAKLF